MDVGVIVIIQLIASAWLWVGWFLSLRISNGLQWDALWKRAGVQVLTWLAPAAFSGTLIFGTYSICMLIMAISGWIFTQEIDPKARDQMLAGLLIFSVSAPLLWITLHLNRRASDYWAQSETLGE